MNELLLINANLVLPEAIMEHASLLIKDGIIEEIFPKGSLSDSTSDIPRIDCTQKWIFPGIIDLHTDALEHEIAPRPRADFDIGIALRELERKMCGNGYHTVYHSMYLGYTSPRGGSSIPRDILFNRIFELAQQQTLIRNKIHLRYEITGIDDFELCMDLLDQGCIELLSINDHTPGQGQYGKELYVKSMMDKGKTEEEALASLQEHQNTPKLSNEQLYKMVNLAHSKGIPIASHDDDTPDKVERMYRMGVRICEFPVNMQTAHFAMNKKMTVIGGASNVLRGGSLTGNLHVAEGIAEGNINCLCSDYYPPAMLHSLFTLNEKYEIPYEKSVQLVSLNPAEAMGLQRETGSITKGKNADLMILEMIDQIPLVTHNIVGGKIATTHSITQST